MNLEADECNKRVFKVWSLSASSMTDRGHCKGLKFAL